ncbi:hypothetical protein ACFZCV_10265 [Streptomyces sp. NPDC007920]|uniref:hypothetical protein n=1 Tax=Streptomyces sp. NPDC007920 TaxID=3364794 RepID=UPI0036EEB692
MRRPIQPFTGYQVTAFTNDEEEAVGLPKRARWTVENELVEMGVDFTKGEMWKPYTVVDRNLFTGQNPALGIRLGGTPAQGSLDDRFQCGCDTRLGFLSPPHCT